MRVIYIYVHRYTHRNTYVFSQVVNVGTSFTYDRTGFLGIQNKNGDTKAQQKAGYLNLPC